MCRTLRRKVVKVTWKENQAKKKDKSQGKRKEKQKKNGHYREVETRAA